MLISNVRDGDALKWQPLLGRQPLMFSSRGVLVIDDALYATIQAGEKVRLKGRF